MRQLMTSMLDTILGVGTLITVAIAAVNPSTTTLVVAAVFVVIGLARLANERMKIRRAARPS